MMNTVSKLYFSNLAKEPYNLIYLHFVRIENTGSNLVYHVKLNNTSTEFKLNQGEFTVIDLAGFMENPNNTQYSNLKIFRDELIKLLKILYPNPNRSPQYDAEIIMIAICLC